MEKPSILLDNLKQFSGTSQYFFHCITPNRYIYLTDGCQYLKEQAECSWLFDLIITHQLIPEILREHFQVWKLKRLIGNNYLVTCDDGNKNIVYHENVNTTDFPLKTISVWVIDGIALLPTEY